MQETNIKPDEFKNVCKCAKLLEVQNSKTNAFKNANLNEGIELINGKIHTFAIKTNLDKTKEKVDDQPVNDKAILSVIAAFEVKEAPPNEIKINEIIQGNKEEVIGCMPNVITSELIKKWQLMSVAERLILLQNTDPGQIEERDGRAGQKYKYVSIGYMIKCANMAFGFAWSVQVKSWIETATEIICQVEIIVDMGNKAISKSAIGHKDLTFRKGTKDYLCKGDDYKAAEADGIKKALSLFGIAQDVYGGEV